MTPGKVAASEARSGTWLTAIRFYLALTVVGHLIWEALQLPLYTIWVTGTAREQAFAVVHCTGGDVLIALSGLIAALVLIGSNDWPQAAFARVAALALTIGVLYTTFSEWLNVAVRASWAYSPNMPIVPLLGARIGLAPLLQWIIVPAIAFALSRVLSRPVSSPVGQP
jgi:hypothetical protein